MAHLVAIDLETSGLDPEIHEIIEVGMVWREPGSGTVQEAEFSLPFSLDRANAEALEINGYSSGRDMAPLWTPFQAGVFLHKTLTDAHLIIKNPVFDVGFLKAFFKSHGYGLPKWHHRTVDITSLAMGRFKTQRPPNSAEVASACGINNDNVHSALGDARWNWNVFQYLTT